MPAGNNVKVTIWEINYDDDDIVGGSMPTGTPLCKNTHARFGQRDTNQLLLQQGIESESSFFLMVQPQVLDIEQRHEVEITGPNNHFYYGERFRVLGEPVRPAFNSSDRRAYMVLNMSRSDQAHRAQ